MASLAFGAPRAHHPKRAAGAQELGGLRYRPQAGDDERPLITQASGSPQGTGYALVATFTRPPSGTACGSSCARATLFLDTDDDRSTGLQLGHGALETGADLAVSLVGMRTADEGGGTPFLQVRVRLLGSGPEGAQGEQLQDLDSRTDPERVQVTGNKVYVLFDTSDPRIPRGKRMRLVYHPPASPAAEGVAPGLVEGKAGAIKVVNKKGKKAGAPLGGAETVPPEPPADGE